MKIITPTVSVESRFIPDGESMPLEALLDPVEVCSIVGNSPFADGRVAVSCRILRIRYSPGRHCTVSYKIMFEDEVSVRPTGNWFYIKCFSKRKFERMQSELANRDRAGSDQLWCVLAERNAVLYKFPGDLHIPGLQLMSLPDKLQGLLQSCEAISSAPGSGDADEFAIEPLRYKPENRFVGKLSLAGQGAIPDSRKEFIIRFERVDDKNVAAKLSGQLQEALAEGYEVQVPRFLGDWPELGLSVAEVVDGVSLAELLRSDKAEQAIVRTANALASFHKCGVAVAMEEKADPPSERCDKVARFLSQGSSEIAATVDEIACKVSQLASDDSAEATGLVHGDFHQGQVLISDKTVWIIDLDRASSGDAIADTGNMLAQLRVLKLKGRLTNAGELEQKFIDVYQKAVGKKLSEAKLRQWMVVGLLELAAKDFRRLKPDWPVSVSTILDECTSVLMHSKSEAWFGLKPERATKDERILNDEALPGMATLRDPERIRDLVNRNTAPAIEVQECHVEYVRYKPGTNCVVSYRLRVVESGKAASRTIIVSGKCYRESEFTAASLKALNKQRVVDWLGAGVIVLPDDKICLFVFPNDSELDGLETLIDSRKIRRILYEQHDTFPRSEWRISHKRMKLDVIRYKPEKRAVVRLSSYATNIETNQRLPFDVYVRHYRDDRGKREFALQDKLTKRFHSAELLIPKPITYVPGKRLLLMEGMEGETLSGLLHKSTATDMVGKAGTALARLHLFDDVSGIGLPSLEWKEIIKSNQNTLVRIVPEYRSTIDEIADGLRHQLSQRCGGNETFIHGDFHPGQILIQESGAAILDFDRSCMGDRLCDVGNFVAHLSRPGTSELPNAQALIREFVAQYESSAGETVDRDKLMAWTGFALFALAVGPFRRQEKQWQDRIGQILARGLEIMR